MPLIVPFGNSAPKVDRTAWAAPNATRIGAGSNIQDNVVMHTDAGLVLTVGSRVSIGHGAVIHGCTIEDDCLIGMNATILNGAVIGAGSLIAAGAVVLENTIVPRGS